MKTSPSLPEVARPRSGDAAGPSTQATNPDLPAASSQPIPEASARATAERLRAQLITRAEQLVERAHGGQVPGQLRLQPAANDLSQAATNEAVAKEALEMVRLALYNKETGSFKSSNKLKYAQQEAEFARITKATEGAAKPIDLTNLPQPQNPLARQARDAALYSKNLWESTGINCRGLALAVQDYVGHRYPQLQTSTVVLGIQHLFATIGTLPPECARQALHAWPRHIFVCDPWTNIACAAPDYPQRFLEKMQKWQSQGKAIISSATAQWVWPTDRDWCACVNDVPQLLTRFHFESGEFVSFPMDARLAAVVRATTVAGAATVATTLSDTPAQHV